MSAYLILMIVTTAGLIERPYEFTSMAECEKAVLQVQRAFEGKQKPIVFCSPTDQPFKPGQVVPIQPHAVNYRLRGGRT